MSDAPLQNFARAFGAPGVVEDAFEFVRDNVTFSGRAKRGSKGALMGVRLTTVFEARLTAAAIVLRRERPLDRIGKALRINREFATEDAAFDERIYIEADVPDATLARVLRNPSVRNAVLQALEPKAFTSLTIQPEGKLVYDVPTSNLKVTIDVARALDSAKALLDGLQAVPRDVSEGGYRGGPPFVLEARIPVRRRRGLAVFAYGVALWVGTWLLERPPTLDSAAAHLGLIVGALAAVLHLVLLGVIFAGRSTSLRTVMLFGVLFVWTTLVAGERIATWANATMDRGPRATIDCKIAMIHPSKGSPYAEARVADGASAPLDLSISTATRNPTLTIGFGALGARWVESVQPVNR